MRQLPKWIKLQLDLTITANYAMHNLMLGFAVRYCAQHGVNDLHSAMDELLVHSRACHGV